MEKLVTEIFDEFYASLTPDGQNWVKGGEIPNSVHFKDRILAETATKGLIEKLFELIPNLSFEREVVVVKKERVVDYVLEFPKSTKSQDETIKVLVEVKPINTNLLEKTGAVGQISKALKMSGKSREVYKFGIVTDGGKWFFVNFAGKIVDMQTSQKDFAKINRYLENKEKLPNASADSKLSNYNLDVFKEQYDMYFSSVLETLKNTHKGAFIKGRECRAVKWCKTLFIYVKDAEDKKCYTMQDILIDTSISKKIAIIGAMGCGKSVYIYQLMEKMLYLKDATLSDKLSDTLILFGEFAQWHENIETNDPIEILINLAFQSLKAFVKDEYYDELCDQRVEHEFKGSLEEYIRSRKVIAFIDGFDEFSGDARNITSLIENLKHRIVIIGRDSSIRGQERSIIISEKAERRIMTLKLNDFTNTQVQKFIKKFPSKRQMNKKIGVSTVAKWAPIRNTYPGLNYKSPLVLKSILRNHPKEGDRLSGYSILEKIATGTFESFVGNKYGEPRFQFTWKELKGLKGVNPEDIMVAFFETHKQIAFEILKNGRNLKSITVDKICKRNNVKIKRMLQDITSGNSGFLIKYENSFHFKSDRMFDFFLASLIREKINKQEVMQEILSKIMENTVLYRKTILFLRATFKEPEQVNKIAKYAKLALSSNKNLCNLKWLKIPWYNYEVQTKGGKLLNLNGKDMKFPSIIAIGGYLLFGLGKKIKNRLLLKRIVQFSELQKLDLSDNRLSSLPESISSLQELRVLWLDGNRLSSYLEILFSLKNLQELYLHYNHLSSLPEGISSLHKLQILDLSGNALSSLPESIAKLKKLQWLYLQHNRLSSLPECIFSLQELRILLLRGNRLSSFPERLSKLQELQELDLSQNRLSSLPERLSKFHNLFRLYLDNNQLSSLPESLSSLKNLQELYLHYNQLSSLPESLSSLKHLQELDLHENHLSSLPKNLSSLKNLQELYLQYNQLSSLPRSFFKLQNLQKLHLDGKLLLLLLLSKSMKANLEKLRKNGCEIVKW